MQTTELLWVEQLAKVKSLEQRTEETPGLVKQAERQKRCTEFRLPTRILERSVASNSAVRVLSSELQTAETTGLSRHHTHCLRARVHSMQSPLPMLTPEPLLATLA